MTYDFDSIVNRHRTDSVKWNRFGEDVLPLWVADMDFPSPPPIINAIKDRLDHGVFGYPLTQESTKNSICGWMLRRHNWRISVEDILLFPGVVPAFNIASRATTNPGDSVLIQTPAYHPFFDIPKNLNIQANLHPLKYFSGGRYGIDIHDFLKTLMPSTRIFMLCNPHNPTGRVFLEDELRSMAEVCLERNIIICSDEIHSDIVYPPNRHIPIASLSREISDITITLVSPSKTFNIAGLKSSAVIIKNKSLRERFLLYARGAGGFVNILGCAALEASYNHCEDWLNELLVYLENNRQILADFIQSELPGVNFYLPEGTYLGWLDFRATGLKDPGAYLLENARVALNSGEWFGDEYGGFVRLNFGCPSSILLTALERIKSSLVSP